jgi:hypothetical protein
MSWGNTETWKVVYNLPPEQQNNGRKGVALVEAANRQDAMYNFMQEYRGQFFTVESCEKLLG